MRLDIYQAETARIATEQGALLDEARERLLAGDMLTPLERNGVLHALQVLIENALGKAKQVIKARNEPVPVAAYEAFSSLARLRVISETELTAWLPIIGLRNRIVHDYMNLDMDIVLGLIKRGDYEHVRKFLLATLR